MLEFTWDFLFTSGEFNFHEFSLEDAAIRRQLSGYPQQENFIYSEQRFSLSAFVAREAGKLNETKKKLRKLGREAAYGEWKTF